MSRTDRVLLLVAAWPVLLCSCALPFVSSSSPGPRARPTGLFGHETPMVSNASGPALAVLPDGRVVAAGGYDAARGGSPDAEIYDPLYNTWSALPSMPVARGLHSATTLLDGSVLLAGGISPAGDKQPRDEQRRGALRGVRGQTQKRLRFVLERRHGRE